MGLASKPSVAGAGNCKGGGKNALDNFRDSPGSVAAWNCEFLHTGRIHPHIARDRIGGASHSVDLWASGRLMAFTIDDLVGLATGESAGRAN